MVQPKTIFDPADEPIEEAAVAEANAQIDAGGGIPHEVVGEWLQKLARGEAAAPSFLDDRRRLCSVSFGRQMPSVK